MARFEERLWEGNFAGLTRRDRRPCRYSVYLPDSLVGRPIVFDGDVAADLADAEAELVRLNTTVEALSDTEALARLLPRAESVASSRIEGLVVGGRRLLRQACRRYCGRKAGKQAPPCPLASQSPYSAVDVPGAHCTISGLPMGIMVPPLAANVTV